MWERLIGWFHMMWDAGKKVEAHSDAIDELQESDRRIIRALQTLAAENELLRQALLHERELRERDGKELELKLRLQISEELRRLPPAKDK